MSDNHILSYKTLLKTVAGEYSEKRSKFLAFANYVSSEEEAKEKIFSYKKKYYDARHICFAYVIGQGGEYSRSNDDGEPAGTAGKPILAQIQKYGLTYTLVVVIRYYGGIQLGAANLGRAYRTAAENALSKALIQRHTLTSILSLTCSYSNICDVELSTQKFNLEILQRNYHQNNFEAIVAVPLIDKEKYEKYLSKIYNVKYKEIDNGEIKKIQ